jgi:hypothetical protein
MENVMSAQLVDFETFKLRREQRPAEYYDYIERLLHAYPCLIRAEAEDAVEQWYTQKDVPEERLWADSEEIFCVMRVPLWDDSVDKLKAQFIPTGIAFRAAYLSGRNLILSFACDMDEADSHYYVWHVEAERIGNLENSAVIVTEQSLEEDPDDADNYGIINFPHLYAEERLDAMRIAMKHLNEWATQKAVVDRWKKYHNDAREVYTLLSEGERDLFDSAKDFEEWWG